MTMIILDVLQTNSIVFYCVAYLAVFVLAG